MTCIVEEIHAVNPATLKDFMEAIQRLPSSLEDAYNNILMRCPNRERTLNILRFIVAAKRPLEIDELDVMLALLGREDIDRCWYADLRQHIAGPDARLEQIRQQCGFFLRIVGSTVHLIHQTAREFLVERDDVPPPKEKWKHCIRLSEAHELLATICIHFLRLRDFEVESERDQDNAMSTDFPIRFGRRHCMDTLNGTGHHIIGTHKLVHSIL